MIKKISGLLVFIFISGVLFCQKINLNKETKKYFDYINSAKRAVYIGQYEKADSLYQCAFEETTQAPFQIDYENSLILADILNLDDRIYNLIQKLYIEKGIDTIGVLRILPTLKTRVNTWKEIKKNNDQWERRFLLSKDTFYSNEILKIFITDQLFHNIKGKITPQAKHRRDSIDRINLEKITNLIQDYGFPSEESIGGYINDYNYSNIIYALFKHFIQNNDFEKVYPIILRAIEGGKLHPSIFANLLDIAKEGFPKTKRCAFSYQNSLIEYVGSRAYMPFIEYSQDNFNCINSNRINIGLDSFHVSQKQFICQGILYHPKYRVSRFVFEPYVEISHLPYFLFENDQETLQRNTIRKLEEKIDTCPCICEN